MAQPLATIHLEVSTQAGDLQEDYESLLSDPQEPQGEQNSSPDKDLVNKEKDINKLFKGLKNKISEVVRSSSLPPLSKEPLVYMAHVILEEEKRHSEPGTMQGWRESWKEAIQDRVRDLVKKVPLESREKNVSWLAVHLGILGKTLEENLEKVERDLVNLYPPDFNVLETYESCHREAVTEHVKDLLERVTKMKDYHALLEFLVHRWGTDYEGSEILQQIKTLFCQSQKEDFMSSLGNIIVTEQVVWKLKERPEKTDDGFFTSSALTNICQVVESYKSSLKGIDANLGSSVVRICLEELVPFCKRFEETFSENTSFLLTSEHSDLLDICLWAQYHITYINSFHSIKEHVQCYRNTYSVELEKQLDGLTYRLSQKLMKYFQKDFKPFLDAMMTKKWLRTEKHFNEVTSRIEIFYGLCKSMRAPPVQGSSLNWLLPLGDDLSDIIGTKDEKNTKDLLIPLVNHFPDIREILLFSAASLITGLKNSKGTFLQAPIYGDDCMRSN
ncbi:hypothetical protein DNTS_030020 [Danionella cerebrum]|uniref:Exocyst complex component Sec6 n=1 Tax=Danionella cerebrum TaxID=2873325 RepID=A0A553NRT9_9TELE|nr:hypothetical protein DNTS_030020 [Danionella translucida]